MRRLAALLVLWLALFLPGPGAAQDDGSYLETLLEDSLSGAGRTVSIAGFRGALSSTARLDTLTIADADGVWITLRDVTLDWSRAALLGGRLEIAKLAAGEIDMPRLPRTGESLPSPEARRFALPELPVSVEIGEISAQKLRLGAPVLGQGAEMRFSGSLYLAGGAGRTSFDLERIDTRRGTIQFNGSFANATESLSILFHLEEGPDGITANLLGLPGRPSVEMRAEGAGVLDRFSATLGLGTDANQRLAGRVTLAAGQDEGRELTLSLGGDLRPLLEPQYRAFFGPDSKLAAKGIRHGDGRLQLQTLDLATEAMRVAGSADFDVDRWPERFDLSAEIGHPGAAAVVLPLTGPPTRLATGDLTLRYDRALSEHWVAFLQLDQLTRDGNTLQSLRATGQGRVRPAGGTGAARISGAFDMEAQGLALADPAMAEAVGDHLRGRIAFEHEDGGPLRLSEVDLGGGDVTLSGAVALDRVPGALDLTLVGKTRLSFADAARFSGLAGRALSGAGAFDLIGVAAWPSGAFDVDLKGTGQGLAIGEPRVDALLQGGARLSLSARRDTTGITLRALDIASDHASASARGVLRSGASDLSFTARLIDAVRVVPGMSGGIDLSGTARQAAADWDVDLAAEGPGLDARAQGTVTIGPDGPRRADGRLTASVARLADFASLAGRALRGALDLEADGEVDLQTGGLSLSAEMSGRDLAIGQAELDALMRGASTGFARIARSDAGDWQIGALELKTEELTATITEQATGGLKTALSLRNVGLIVPELSGAGQFLGTVTPQNGDFRLDGQANGPGGATAKITGTLDGAGRQNALQATGRVPLALINPFIKPRSVSGQAAFDLTLNGGFVASALAGRVTTSGARLTLPAQRLSLSPIEARADLSGGVAQIEATATSSSGGRILLSGPVALSQTGASNLTARLDGVGFVEPGLFKTRADGALRLTGTLRAPLIGGEISLRQLDLQVPDGVGGAVEDLADLRHIGEPPEVRRTRARAGLLDSAAASPASDVALDLAVHAPSRIFIRGRGLDAELGGQIRLTGSAREVISSGRFDLIRGRLDILGKRFELTEGYATLQGALDPFVRLVAQTSVDDRSIRIIVEGNASAPDVTFAATPDLPEDEILALLVFGHGLARVSPLQAVQLAAAVRTLAGKGGSGIVGRLRKTFGLDDLDITVGEDGTTGARIGKYLGENIYSDITVGSDGKSEINLNLTLSPALTARGSVASDGNSGLGLYFQKDY